MVLSILLSRPVWHQSVPNSLVGHVLRRRLTFFFILPYGGGEGGNGSFDYGPTQIDYGGLDSGQFPRRPNESQEWFRVLGMNPGFPQRKQ